MIRLTSVILCFLLLACSSSDDEKVPLEGERIPVINHAQDLRPSSSPSLKPVTLPAPIINQEWPQKGGVSHHAMQNLSLGSADQLEQIWATSIGKGAQKYIPLTTQPVIAEGKVFTLDTNSIVSAFHDQTGRLLWRTSIRHPKEDEAVIGGGVSFDNGVLFATSGYTEALALNPENGSILWRAPLIAPARAAPTIQNGRVFVKMLNNSLSALDASNGALLWTYESIAESTGLLGDSSPAADQDMVVTAMSSGELAGLRQDTGAVLWQDNLSNTLRLGQNMLGLSDIRGLPVIFGDAVLAVSYGGKMVVIDKTTGKRKWQQDISSGDTPWVAGNSVFVKTSDQQLTALNLLSGEILWIYDLPKFEDSKNRKKPIHWTAPIVGGGRLILAGSHGQVIELNPASGDIITHWSVRKNIKLTPVISDETLFFLFDDGTLAAYK